MARVEVFQEYIDGSGELVCEPFFPTPNYPETPPPTFEVDSPNGYVQTAIRQNGSPDVFDIYQTDSSVLRGVNNTELVGHDPYYHVGVVTPDEPFMLQHIIFMGVPTTLFAEVRKDEV